MVKELMKIAIAEALVVDTVEIEDDNDSKDSGTERFESPKSANSGFKPAPKRGSSCKFDRIAKSPLNSS